MITIDEFKKIGEKYGLKHRMFDIGSDVFFTKETHYLELKENHGKCIAACSVYSDGRTDNYRVISPKMIEYTDKGVSFNSNVEINELWNMVANREGLERCILEDLRRIKEVKKEYRKKIVERL